MYVKNNLQKYIKFLLYFWIKLFQIMRKILLLLFIAFQLQSCLKPSLYSVVDNTLFFKPYLDPQFYILFSGKKEQKIANKIKEDLAESFQAVNLYPFVQLIDLDKTNEDQIKSMMTKALHDKTADVFFTFKLTHITLYEGNVTDFNYSVTAFDYKINKEIWKAKVYSPWGSGKEMSVQFVNKLKNEKVL